MKKKGKIIMSIMLCIVLFATMLVVPGSTNVKADGEEPEYPLPPDDDEPGSPPAEEYNLTLTNISAYSVSEYPENIFVNTLTFVNFTLSNNGTNYITDVMVGVYEVKYNYIDTGGNVSREPYTVTERFLTTLSYGNFLPMMGKTETVTWTPTNIGRHALKLRISYNEAKLHIVYEDRATFVVWRNDLQVVEIPGDWIIDENVTMDNVTIIIGGDIVVTENGNLTLLYCQVRAPDIIIMGPSTWVYTEVNMGCNFRGHYRLWITNTGSLTLYGCTIYNSPPQYTYHFWVYGRLRCYQWWGVWPPRPTEIMHVFGQDNGAIVTGGIMLMNTNPFQQSSFRNTIVAECDTIGIGCYGSWPTIGPDVTIQDCGSPGPPSYGYGKGIFAEGTGIEPITIESCRIRYISGRSNYGFGIWLRDGASATISDNRIERNGHSGIFCYYSSSDITIQSNPEIEDNRYYGILCYNTQPTSEGPTIEENTIEENYYGISAYYCTPTISGNEITENNYGIRLHQASALINNYNEIRWNNLYGIYAFHCLPTIQYNYVEHNGFIGIYLVYSLPETIIRYNWIRWNGEGIHLFWQCSATIEYNWINLNDNRGIYLRFQCSPTIIENEIASNINTGIYLEFDCSPIIGTRVGMIYYNNDIISNRYGVWSGSGSAPTINWNNIMGNSEYGVYNDDTIEIDAQNNYWNHPSGPSGAGPGVGDAVSDYVNYDPWSPTPIP